MSGLRERVNEELKTAMKARDQLKVDTFRLLNSDLKKIEIDERRTLEDKDVLQVIQKSIKRRQETIEFAKTQNRPEIAEKEAAEQKILETLLPPQLDEAALIATIEAVIKEVAATTKKEQGKVMAALMPKIQGKADGKLVAKLVGERLA